MNNFFNQIAIIIPYWLAGITVGAFLRTFYSDSINKMLLRNALGKHILIPTITASILGAISPITLFGIIPILYAFDIKNNKKLEIIIVSFITSSILISPNIFIFTISLGFEIAILRLICSIMAGVITGLIINLFTKDNETFLELTYQSTNKEKTASNNINKDICSIKVFLNHFYAAFKKTGLNLMLGVLISYFLYIIIPDSIWELTFSNLNLSVPISAFLSIGLYQCGGGSIPILHGLMREGLPVGAAITFMMVGPLTKMTNLTALKSILSFKKLFIYCTILIIYMLIIGWSLGL